MKTAADGLDDPGDESFAGRTGGILRVAGEMAIGDQLLDAVQRRVDDTRTLGLTRQLEGEEILVRLHATRIVCQRSVAGNGKERGKERRKERGDKREREGRRGDKIEREGRSKEGEKGKRKKDRENERKRERKKGVRESRRV